MSRQILTAFVLLLALSLPAHAQTPAARAATEARTLLDRNLKAHPPALQLESRPARHINASMVFAIGGSKLAADQWFLYMPLPPETAAQTHITYKATPEVSKTAEPTGLKQPLLLWQIQAAQNQKNMVAVNITYSADLLSHKLVPGPPAEIPALPDDQRTLYTAATTMLDWSAPPFQDWLAKNTLRPAANETDLDLARRIFLHLKEHSNFEFKDGIERRVSRTCATMKTDCGGLTALYVAALRANSIPARQLVGRWAQSAKKDEKLYGKPWQQEHIKAEFYADKIGWIPVDVSVAVDYDKKPGSLQHFGQDPGNFLTFHYDADITLNVPQQGQKSIRFMQEPAYFFQGRGSLEGEVKQSDWIVETARGRRP